MIYQNIDLFCKSITCQIVFTKLIYLYDFATVLYCPLITRKSSVQGILHTMQVPKKTRNTQYGVLLYVILCFFFFLASENFAIQDSKQLQQKQTDFHRKQLCHTCEVQSYLWKWYINILEACQLAGYVIAAEQSVEWIVHFTCTNVYNTFPSRRGCSPIFGASKSYCLPKIHLNLSLHINIQYIYIESFLNV